MVVKKSGADDGIRTRDPRHGKAMLYQLSYIRPNDRIDGNAWTATNPPTSEV